MISGQRGLHVIVMKKLGLFTQPAHRGHAVVVPLVLIARPACEARGEHDALTRQERALPARLIVAVHRVREVLVKLCADRLLVVAMPP